VDLDFVNVASKHDVLFSGAVLVSLFMNCWLHICCEFLCHTGNNTQRNRFILLRCFVCLCIPFHRASPTGIINQHKPLLCKPKERSKAGIHGGAATQREVSSAVRDCCGEKTLVVIRMGFRNIGWMGGFLQALPSGKRKHNVYYYFCNSSC
jgi:hypothetical protein